MKAVTFKPQHKDDHSFDRLFLLLKDVGLAPKQITHIKNQVFLLQLENNELIILKIFPQKEKILKQMQLTEHLRMNQFPTYEFHKKIPFLTVRNKTWIGLINYLEPHPIKYSFQTFNSREEGLQLIKQFHDVNDTFPNKEKFLGHTLYEKWQKRLNQFQANVPLLLSGVPSNIINSLILLSNWSLQYMKKFSHHMKKESPTIIHGDTASHNFFRDVEKKLYLIDFDLSQYDYPIHEYIQMAIRILPHINWDVSSLFLHSAFKRYENNPYFLCAIVFPSDCFREINRLLGEVQPNSKKLLNAFQYIREQYNYRNNLFKQIRNMLK